MTTKDQFANTQSFSGPASSAQAITPSDTNDIETASRAIYVGSGGDLAVKMLGGADITFVGLNAGTILPIRVSRIKATGTTAGSIVSLF